MKSSNYAGDLKKVVELAREAGEFVRSSYVHNSYSLIEKKGKRRTINVSDTANDIIINKLRGYFPRDGIVSDEKRKYSLAPNTWYVNSLDGKESFLDSNDQFSVNIGLCYEGVPVMGVVYNPLTREIYYGIKENGSIKEIEGATYNIKAIRQKEIDKMGKNHEKFLETLVVPYDFLELNDDQDGMRRKYASVVSNLHPERIIRNGSLALGMMKLIEKTNQEITRTVGFGKEVKNIPRITADAYVLGIDKPVSLCSLCAPQAIIEFAEGFVSHIDGTPVSYNSEQSKFVKSDTNPELKLTKNPIVIAKGKEESELLQKLISGMI
jgi:fructose-1,6-bisphosphatase/inositol monophosphatase family enzyme